LSKPVVFKHKEFAPNAVLLEAVVLALREQKPTAVLLLPVVLASNAT
jgi:hypothetical protein